MKSWSLPEDVKGEIREMRAEGLTYTNIANYLGIPYYTVIYICDPKRRAQMYKANRKSYKKNRNKRKQQMKEYQKKNRLRLNKYRSTWEKEKRRLAKINSDSKLTT